MPTLETLKGVLQKIDFELERTMCGVDRNPKHITAFPYHQPDCSRTKPLKMEYEGDFALPSGGGVPAEPGRVTGIITECPECGGRAER